VIGARKSFATIWTGNGSWKHLKRYAKDRLAGERLLFDEQSFSSGEHGLTRQSHRSRLAFARRMEQRRVEPSDPNTQQIGRGWFFGAAGFYRAAARPKYQVRSASII
jgi:hypothetical protein